jgi:hypothetical protein
VDIVSAEEIRTTFTGFGSEQKERSGSKSPWPKWQ